MKNSIAAFIHVLLMRMTHFGTNKFGG